MYSLHLTGNPWFLLLILPGLWILRRQYRGVSEAGGAGGFPRAAGMLWALQSLALILMAVSLTAPELRRHKVAFHNPAVLILRDQSGSFRNGAYLGLGGRYRDFEAALTRAYGKRKFDVRVIDFAETAWPVSGFPKPGRPGANADLSADEVPLTSLAALGDFVDSAAVPNLQAAFLFSDGLANLDSGRASRTWRIPLFPVVFAPDSVAEVQPDRVVLSRDEKGGGALGGEAAWTAVGRTGSDPSLTLLQGGKVLLTRNLSAAGGEAGKSRFVWNPEKSVLDGKDPIRAVVKPGGAAADFDPYNDTLDVALAQGRAERNIHVFKPVRSLDEKGMLGVLQAWEGTRVSFFGLEDLGRLALTPKDQVWVEAGVLGSQGRLSAWLQAVPARVVVYSRRDPGRNPQVAGAEMPWRTFSPAAGIIAGKAAASEFPDEIVRLKSLTAESLDAPEPSGPALVETLEGGKRGMLMGRIPLGKGKRAFFFCLPAIWGALFDPQADFAARENIAGYVKAAQMLGDRDDGAIRVSRPGRAFAGVPFDVDIQLPGTAQGGGPDSGGRGGEVTATGPGAPVFSISGGNGYAREWPDLYVKNVTLARGMYRLQLKAGKDVLWRDSMTVAPKAALELARIGFDKPSLEDAASRSGGRVLSPQAGTGEAAGVSSMLPSLPDAQIRMEKTTAIRLYNTLAQCLLILILLSLSWLLRKKWDMD